MAQRGPRHDGIHGLQKLFASGGLARLLESAVLICGHGQGLLLHRRITVETPQRWTLISIALDRSEYGTHSMRRTKATLIYRRTKNLRAVQLLLGHSKLESTVRYLGIEVDDALEISEQTEI